MIRKRKVYTYSVQTLFFPSIFHLGLVGFADVEPQMQRDDCVGTKQCSGPAEAELAILF
jgi:hypothetical protein